MYTVLVTGSRGKTGRAVLDALKDHPGLRLIGASSKPADASQVRLDWGDKATWATAVSGVDALYLVKPTDNLTDPAAPDVGDKVRAFLATSRSLKRVVLLSEIGASGRDESLDERRVERAVEESGTEWTILQPNWFMQNFSDASFYLPAVKSGGTISVPTAGKPTSFIDTRDIADVVATALARGGHGQRTYTLTGPEAYTWSDALAMISEAGGRRVTYVDIALEDFLTNPKITALPEKVRAHYRGVYDLLSSDAAGAVTGHVEAVLGRPARGFKAFVEENAALWRA